MHKFTLKLKQFFDLFRPMSIEDLKALSPSYIGGPPEVIADSVRIPGAPMVLSLHCSRCGASKTNSTTRR